MKRCQRVTGLNFTMCSQVATKKITRKGIARYYCEDCAKIMQERSREKFKVEAI